MDDIAQTGMSNACERSRVRASVQILVLSARLSYSTEKRQEAHFLELRNNSLNQTLLPNLASAAGGRPEPLCFTRPDRNIG